MAKSSSKEFWDKHAATSIKISVGQLHEKEVTDEADAETMTVHAVSPTELMHCHISIQEIRRLIAAIGIGAGHQDMINMHLCNIENSLPINLPGTFNIKDSIVVIEPEKRPIDRSFAFYHQSNGIK